MIHVVKLGKHSPFRQTYKIFFGFCAYMRFWIAGTCRKRRGEGRELEEEARTAGKFYSRALHARKSTKLLDVYLCINSTVY